MEEKESKNYEISFLLKEESGMPDIVSLVKSSGGEVFFELAPLKINLAYPIKKFSSAYFGCINFRMSPDLVAGLRDALMRKENVLRFLIVTPPFARKERKEARIPREKPVVPARKSQLPLSNEAIEKKIEEILQ